MAFIDIENDTVSPEALRSIASGRFHLKVGWGSGPEEVIWQPGSAESICACNVAPCGWVTDDDPDCPHHGIRAVQQPRQRHKVADCPAHQPPGGM